MYQMRKGEEEEGVLRSRFSPVDIPEATSLPQLVLEYAAKYGDKVAMIDPVGKRQMTYAELVTSVRHVRCGLYKHGVCKGDVVLILLPNCMEYPVIFHAVLSLGGVVTACRVSTPPDEVRARITMGDVCHIVTTPELIPQIKEAIPVDFSIKKVFVIGHSEGCVSYEELLRDDASEYPVVFFNVRQDLATLNFSSGTTGLEKPVRTCHYNWVAQMCQLMHPDLALLYEDDVLLLNLSMSHPFVLTAYVNAAIVHGTTFIILPVRNTPYFIEAIQKYKPDVLMLIPPIIDELLSTPNIRDKLSSVHTISNTASYLCPTVELQLRSVLPAQGRFRQIYGLTECAAVIIGSKDDPVGSVGRVLANINCKVVDLEDGHLCGAGETGELRIQGPQVCLGYLQPEDESTNTPTEDGWFQTGDLFRFDINGYFYFIDRVKDIIKFEGLQVPPSELEALLRTHPGVVDAVVVGVPAEVVGELPKAFVMKSPNSTVTATQLMDFISDQVSPPKRLRGGVEFVDFIPRPVSGKVKRYEFRQLEIERKKARDQKELSCTSGDFTGTQPNTDIRETPTPAKRPKTGH